MTKRISQDEALVILQHLLVAAQKARSNIEEATEGMGSSALNLVAPKLFPVKETDFSLIAALLIYSNKGDEQGYIGQGDFFNALTLAGMEPTVEMTYGLLFEEEMPMAIMAYTHLDRSPKEDLVGL